MSNLSVSIVAPKYRHLFAVAPEVQFRIDSMTGGAHPPSVTLKTMAADGSDSYEIPTNGMTLETGGLWVCVNDIPVPNEYKIVGYNLGQPVWGWDTFEWREDLESISFLENKPLAGQLISVYYGDAGFIPLVLPRWVRVQGAHEFPPKKQASGEGTPEEPKFPDHVGTNEIEILKLPEFGPDGQFLGGFQCQFEILSPCTNGLARVTDTGFEYRPNFGYTGRDSFSYRVVTPFGQQSDAACIQLFVGV